jgi:hypothetical protein
MYGVHAEYTTLFSNALRDWRAQRVDGSHADISGAYWHIRSRVGESGPNGACAISIARGHRVRIYHPSDSKVWSNSDGHFQIRVENCVRTNDWFVMGIKWSGSAPGLTDEPSGGSAVTVTNKTDFDSATAFTKWNDTANQILWMKVYGRGETNGYDNGQGGYKWRKLNIN